MYTVYTKCALRIKCTQSRPFCVHANLVAHVNDFCAPRKCYFFDQNDQNFRPHTSLFLRRKMAYMWAKFKAKND